MKHDLPTRHATMSDRAACLRRMQMGELLFGLFPPEAYVPGLTASNPFRSLLPLDLHIPTILQNVV